MDLRLFQQELADNIPSILVILKHSNRFPLVYLKKLTRPSLLHDSFLSRYISLNIASSFPVHPLGSSDTLQRREDTIAVSTTVLVHVAGPLLKSRVTVSIFVRKISLNIATSFPVHPVGSERTRLQCPQLFLPGVDTESFPNRVKYPRCQYTLCSRVSLY